MSDDVAVVQRLFAAVEDRDLDGLLACYSDDVEITEADALPYGGVWRGRDGAVGHAMGFLRTWGDLQGAGEARSTGGSGVTGRDSVCGVSASCRRCRDWKEVSTLQRSASTAFAMTA